MNPSDLEERLARRRAEVERDLAHLCTAGQAPGRLGEAVAHALEGGGKRLRPVLVLAAFDAADRGGPGAASRRRAAIPPAVAVELVHTYSLVHDDLPAMDDDDTRRGRPSCHRAYGEAAAILAGDALLTEAFRVLADPRGYPPDTPAPLVRDLVVALAEAAGHRGMVGGQAVDVGLAGPVRDAESLDALHRGKTGALFVFSAVAGGMAAGATPERLAALRTYGDRLGLAFQIADDVLDLAQDAPGEEAGGPPSYPALLGEADSRARARQLAGEAAAAVEGFGPGAALLVDLAWHAAERRR